MFVDEITLTLRAGHGGAGAASFRRESHEPRGGPSGGDGGRGGSVIFEASAQLNTLFPLRNRRILKAPSGENGRNKGQTGRSGQDLVVEVPLGTLVFDADSGELLGDLVEPGQRMVMARGGDGGRGNIHFASSTNQTPRRAEPGWPGDSRRVRLELKLLADVGLLGYPSVGKSTLIRRISNARPRVADYPFTTLEPNLGVVQWHEYREFVVADIPGIIEGASEGRGLGHQFLRHVERTRVLAHLIEVPPPFEMPATDDDEAAPEELGARDPIGDYERINRELERFDPNLATRPQLVVLNKLDLPYVRERRDELEAHFTALGQQFLAISAVTGEGIEALVDVLGHAVLEAREAEKRALDEA